MKFKIASAGYEDLVQELSRLDSHDRLYYVACKRDRRRLNVRPAGAADVVYFALIASG